MPTPPPAPRWFALRDGTQVAIRPIVPGDGGRLQDGLTRMSHQSRYYRFLAPLRQLSEGQLRYLTEIDHRNHVAWIALDPSDEGIPVLGVARYVRLQAEPDVAEAAVAVVDSHHGLGLGTLLLGLLATAAAASGLRHFRATVLAENEGMLRIFRDLGARLGPPDNGVFQVDMEIPEDPSRLPDTSAGRVFRAVARREIALLAPGPGEPRV